MNIARVFPCLILAALAAGLRAEEKADKLQQAIPPGDDAITAQKQDFETIKSTKAPLEQTRGDLPRMSAPTLHDLPSDVPAVPEMNPDKKKAGKNSKSGKSANWLLDAMNEKPGETLEEMKEAGLSGEIDREKALAQEKSTGRTSAKVQTATPAAKLAAGADNPLTSYMTAWMTPHDFELLKPKAAETNLASIAPKGAAFDRPVEASLFDQLLHSDAAAGPAHSPVVPSLSPDSRTNPYLTDLVLPGVNTGKDLISLPTPVAPIYSPPVPVATAPRNEPAAQKNPALPADLLKAQDDAKYFPQLKRF